MFTSCSVCEDKLPSIPVLRTYIGPTLETGSCYMALANLELAVLTRLALSLQSRSCVSASLVPGL